MPNTQIPSTALDLVKHFEGLRLKAYLCPAGVPTIGYGHTDRVTAADVAAGRTITGSQADALLLADLQDAARAVTAAVRVPLNADQLGALASFVFNVGGGNFRSSTLLKLLNKGDFDGAAGQFTRWCKATVDGRLVTLAGLVKRRQAEQALFEGRDWRACGPETMPQEVRAEGPTKPLTRSVTAQAAAGSLAVGGILATIAESAGPAVQVAQQAQDVARQLQEAQEHVTGALSILDRLTAASPAAAAITMGVGLAVVLYRLWRDRRA